jgi:hypothetical protein
MNCCFAQSCESATRLVESFFITLVADEGGLSLRHIASRRARFHSNDPMAGPQRLCWCEPSPDQDPNIRTFAVLFQNPPQKHENPLVYEPEPGKIQNFQ